MVYLSQKVGLFLIFKLLKRAHIITLPWAPFCTDTPRNQWKDGNIY